MCKIWVSRNCLVFGLSVGTLPSLMPLLFLLPTFAILGFLCLKSIAAVFFYLSTHTLTLFTNVCKAFKLRFASSTINLSYQPNVAHLSILFPSSHKKITFSSVLIWIKSYNKAVWPQITPLGLLLLLVDFLPMNNYYSHKVSAFLLWLHK